jgi:hypothetical protein
MPRAIARKLYTGIDGPRGFGGMCPQYDLASSLLIQDFPYFLRQ